MKPTTQLEANPPVPGSTSCKEVSTIPISTSQVEATAHLEPTSETEAATRREATSRYEVFDCPTHGFQCSAKYGTDPVGRIVAAGTSLTEVLRVARRYVASDKEWTGRPQIEIRVNNNSPWKVTALHLRLYGEKLLVKTFHRRLMIYRYPAK